MRPSVLPSVMSMLLLAFAVGAASVAADCNDSGTPATPLK